MKCYLCSKKGHIRQQKNRDICNACFCKLIEKRVRKYTRMNKLFSRNDKINVKGINKYFVERILKDLPIKFVSNGKKVILWTLDDEINEFLKSILGGKVKKTKDIKLLKVVTDKELETFAKIKKIKFKPNKKDLQIQKFLDEIEAKHGNIKYNLLKNINMLNKLTEEQ